MEHETTILITQTTVTGRKEIINSQVSNALSKRLVETLFLLLRSTVINLNKLNKKRRYSNKFNQTKLIYQSWKVHEIDCSY